MRENAAPSLTLCDNGRVVLNCPVGFLADLVVALAAFEAEWRLSQPHRPWVETLAEKLADWFRAHRRTAPECDLLDWVRTEYAAAARRAAAESPRPVSAVPTGRRVGTIALGETGNPVG